MEIAKIYVNGVRGLVLYRAPMPAGIVGATVRIEYSELWDGLHKTVVFKGAQTRDILNAGDVVTIPPEVVAKPGYRLQMGVYGFNDEGTIVIPTLWADLGVIHDAANPSGDESTDPALPVWAQLQVMIGDLDELSTNAKSSLVAAVNELAERSGGDVSPEEIRRLVEEYLVEHPVEVSGAVKTVNGVAPDEKGNVEITIPDSSQNANVAAIDYDQNVRSVNHRGYSANAPENTIPAYILSKQMGFTYVEADVSFTSDGVAVLLHDSTIDRTSNGSGSISAMTYAQASQYDYGSWKSAKYAGTRIPTFEEFIILCKRIGLHPYIELKQNGSYTEAQIQALVSMVKKCGMEGKVTWISFSSTYLGYVKNADATARLGFLYSYDVTAAQIATVQGLQTGENEVYLGIKYTSLTDSGVARCVSANIPLEVWTINSETAILALHPYVTGITSDSLIGGKVLYDAGMVYEYDNGSGGNSGGDDGGETEVTLSSISASYAGGDVAVGTAVTALSGVVVTAHYSDGSTAVVTGYTLSGTITEERNIITVSYGGKTTTFSVTGVAEETIDLVSNLVYDLNFASYSTDGTITNDGSSTANITIVNTSGKITTDSDGAIVLCNDDSVSVPFTIDQGNKAGSGSQQYTWAVKVKTFELSGLQYDRVMRGNNDVPSVYVHQASSTLHGKTVVNAKIVAKAIGTDSGALTDSDYYVGTNAGTTGACFELTENMWFVFTHDGTTANMYINGVLSGTQGIAHTGYVNTYNATSIGIGNTNQQANGTFNSLTISEFKVWERALTAAEVAELCA